MNILPMEIAWLVVNRVCNNCCTFCYDAKSRSESKAGMSIKTARDALRLIFDLGVGQFVIIGGEPTLYRHLEFIIKESVKNAFGPKPVLVTNGRKLAKMAFAKKLFTAGLRNLNISLQGSSKESHTAITRKKAAYDETIQGIKNAIEIGFNLSASLTISYSNLETFEENLRVLSALGVKSFTVGLEVPNINSSDKQKPINGLIEVMKKSLATAQSLGAAISFSTALPICLTQGTELEGLVGGSCIVHTGTGLAIDCHGDVLPCVHWSGHSVENIYEDKKLKDAKTFLEDWNDGEAKEVRQLVGDYFSEKCLNCDKKQACYGGCPLLRIGRDSSLYIKGQQGG